MDVVDVYARLGSYRAAGEVCGVDPKTVKRKVLAHGAGQLDDQRAGRASVPKNTDGVRTVVLDLVRKANGLTGLRRVTACFDRSRGCDLGLCGSSRWSGE